MRKRKHNWFWLVFSLLWGCLLSGGCDSGQDIGPATESGGAAPRRGGIYRLPLTQNPASLDPARVHHNYGLAVIHQVFDGLIRFDPYLAPRPSLAETWRIEDNGRVYHFTLRGGARFHDGQLVTVEDVIFSISRLLRIDPAPAILPHLMKIEGAGAYRSHNADRVTGLQASGESELKVRLVEPHVPFLTALGMYHAMVVPRHVAGDDPAAFGRHPVGSGPFRFVAWEPDRFIRLERFDRYFGGESLLDGIHFKIYTERQHQRVLEDFKRGELEEMPVFSDAIKQELAGPDPLQWFHRPSLSLFFYGINTSKPPLDDPSLRRALSAAIDRRRLVETVFNGRYETAQSIIPPGMPGYRPPAAAGVAPMDAPDFPARGAGSDPASPPPTVEIASAYDSPRVRAEMALVRDDWEKLGVRLTTKFIPDWQAFNAYIRSEAVQVYRYVWFADMPDPDSILYPLFASDSADNFMRFDHAQVDALLNRARGIIDPVARAELYRRSEGLIQASAPLIPLFHLSVDQVYRGTVKNMQPSALGAHAMSLHRVWLDPQQ